MSSPLIAPAAAQESTPTEYVDSIIVRYEPGVPATDVSGNPTASNEIETNRDLEVGQSIGLGYRTIEFNEPVPVTEAEKIAAELTGSSKVAVAEPNYEFSISTEFDPTSVTTITQTLTGNFNWGLDRIDQSALPLDGNYKYPSYSTTPTVYVVDSGIRATHSEFQTNGVSRVLTGFSAFASPDNTADDCQGHGTHVAGIIGGNTTGVLKNANLVPVKVLNCSGAGDTSTLISGINWIISNHTGSTAVANFSLGSSSRTNRIAVIDDAMTRLIADGVQPIVASGNSNDDACFYSPANSPGTITVNASTDTDSRDSRYSNFGACTDLYAPGQSIFSAYPKNSANVFGDNFYAKMSGTSMAAPFVTGIAANLLMAEPTLTPSTLSTKLLTFTNPVITTDKQNDPNRLIYQPQAGFVTPVNNNSSTVDKAAANTVVDTNSVALTPVPTPVVEEPAPAAPAPAAPAPVAAPAPAAAPAAPAPSGAISQSVGSRRVINVSVSAPAGSTTAIQIQARKNQRVAYKTAAGKTKYRNVKVTYWRTVSTTPTAATASIRVRAAGTYRVLVNTPSGPIEGSPFSVR